MIRLMELADLEAVTMIERASPSPWNSIQIGGELSRTDSCTLVLESESGTVFAWCCARYCGEEAELLKISVLPEYRGHGHGGVLLDETLHHLARHGVGEVFLEVRAHNRPALTLYQKIGFLQVGTRSNYYANPTEDASVLRLQLFS